MWTQAVKSPECLWLVGVVILSHKVTFPVSMNYSYILVRDMVWGIYGAFNSAIIDLLNETSSGIWWKGPNSKNPYISARRAFSALLASCRWPAEINRGHSTLCCNVRGDVKESIRQKQIITVSERDQTVLASAPTHAWFTGELIKCYSSLSGEHDNSLSSVDKLLLKPMITFLHLATKHNRMWLLVLGAKWYKDETPGALRAWKAYSKMEWRSGNLMKTFVKSMSN